MRRYTFILDQLWEVDYGIVDNEPVEILSKAVGKSGLRIRKSTLRSLSLKEHPDQDLRNLPIFHICREYTCMLHDKDIREPLFDFLEETYGKIRIIAPK